MNTRGFLSFGAIVLFTTAGTYAQSGAALLLKPWAEGERLESQADVLIFGETDVKEPIMDDRDDFRMRWYEGQARTRLGEQRGAPAIGVDVSHIEFGTWFAPIMPERLMDYSIGFGMGVGEIGGWEVGVTGGFGVAGDRWEDSDGWYAIGNLIFSKEIDDRRSWQLLLNYNGNRTFLPDAPLPGIAFNHEVTDTFRYTAGIPFSSISWTFLPQVTLDATYLFPYTVDATLSWRPIETIRLFGSFQNRYNRYRWEFTDDLFDAPDEYIFFRQRRVEAGLAWEPCASVQLIIAGGWAFDQEFERGWDSRDADEIKIDIDDTPYVRLGAELSF